jgi:hypothetical protein
MRDWLAKGIKNLGAGTVDGYRILADQHLIPAIGVAKLPRLCPPAALRWTDRVNGPGRGRQRCSFL